MVNFHLYENNELINIWLIDYLILIFLLLRMEADLFDGDSGVDSRIPYDVLRLPEAETVYKNHLNQLHAHQQRLE